MKNSLLLLCVLIGLSSCKLDQSEKEDMDLNAYLNGIRQSPAELQAFFQAMPKGGDLHHHSQGSVKTESYLRCALKDSMFINPITYHAYKKQTDDSSAVLINDLLNERPEAAEEIIDYWTTRNYKTKGRDGHDWFFSSFDRFLPIFEGHEAEFLSEMCQKASADNISYLETMISVQSVDRRLIEMAGKIPPSMDKEPIDLRCFRWKEQYDELGIGKLIADNVDSLDQIRYRVNQRDVRLMFQVYGVRVIPAKHVVFGQLYLAFASANANRRIVGVNILAPEDNLIALRHYRDHMQMIEVLREYYPDVKVSLHAGELVIDKGLVKDFDLKFHIQEALKVACAQRIGHGVDLLEEDDSNEILQFMKEKDIAVEINLESNEVILETSPDNHPIHAYWKAGVPICISTDDEGVLRTDLTNQYLLLLKYIPDIQYSDIKDLVKNTIQYSYLPEGEKEHVMKDLNKRFEKFEHEILAL